MNEVSMLETLKKEYLGMGYQVEYEKYGPSGIIEGLTMTEKMHFVDWEDACDWAGRVTMNPSVPYVILEMRGQEGQVERFWTGREVTGVERLGHQSLQGA